MKDFVIGILGGMGSYATLDFFNRLLEAFPAEKEWDRPRIIIDNNCQMPSRVLAILDGTKKDELIADMTSSIKSLINSGANKIILACNTSHYFLPSLRKEIPDLDNYIFNIIESCYRHCVNKHVTKAVLIATEGTLESKIFNSYFKDVQLIYPAKEEFVSIRSFIEAVKQNIIDKNILRSFYDYIESKNETVILGCTELPVLYKKCIENGLKFGKNIIDPLQCVIEDLVKDYKK